MQERSAPGPATTAAATAAVPAAAPAPPTDAEAERLAHLHRLLVLDTPSEPLFDRLAAMASAACGTPIALLSLIDAERQWFKANVGLPGVGETPRDVAFCARAIEADAVFEVADATADARFAANPLVTGEPRIRFYAGAPLVTDGARIGTLCVIDRAPRRLSAEQTATLRSLAALASDALAMRRDLLLRSFSARDTYELALHESELRHRALVESQAELVSLADADARLVYVNPAYARRFGRDPGALYGQSLLDWVEPADRAAVSVLVARVLDTGEEASGENRSIAADGREHWIAWTNRRQIGSRGEALLHSVGRDVTARRAAEQALRDSQAMLARTERIAGVGGWQFDLAGQAIVWSSQTRRIHEVDDDYRPELASALAFYAPESRPEIEAAVQRGLADGTSWDLELQLVTATGRRIWVRAQGDVELENGRAVRLSGAFQDITERRTLQTQLAASERFVRQITDSLPLRIAYADRELRFRFVNQAHCDRFGLPREAILGRTRHELIGFDAEVDDLCRSVLAGTPQRFEYVDETNPAVGPRRIESTLTPDRDAAGRVVGFSTTGIDITERAAAEQALRMLTAVVEHTTDYVVQTDRRGRLTYVNPAARVALGLAAEAPIDGLDFAALNSAETNRLFQATVIPAVAADGVWLGRTVVYAAGGREVPVSHLVIGHRDAAGRIDRYSAVMRDISREIESDRQMQRQTATLSSMIEAMPAVVAVVGADERYRFVNDAYERWFGKSRRYIVGRALAEVLGPADYARSRPYVQRALGGEAVVFEKDYVGSASTRHLQLHYVPLRLADGTIDGFYATAHDITSSKAEASRLQELVQHDPLTGLYNRAGFEAFLDQQLDWGGGPEVAMLYIDLDRFKPINDAHGHAVGDQVLQIFGQRLLRLVRPSDAVARLGGDEFAIVLVGVREGAHACAVAEKVIASAAQPIEIGRLTVEIGASVGVALAAAADGGGWPELLARADAMLYQAKNAGRGRHVGA